MTASPMPRLRGIRQRLLAPRILMIAMVVLLGTAAAYTSMLIQQRQDALSRASRYDLAWAASQSAVELSRLGQTLGLHHMAPTPRSAREVNLRYDILMSRIQLFEGAEFQTFVNAEEPGARLLDQIRDSVVALEPLLKALDADDNLVKATRHLAQITPMMAEFAATANNFGASTSADQQRQLLHLHWAFSAIAVALLLSGAIQLISLGRQNRALEAIRQALAEQNDRFDAAIGNMPHGLAMFDDQSRLIVLNRRLPAMLGLPEGVLRHGFTLTEAGRLRRAGGRPSEGVTLEELAAALDRSRAGLIVHRLGDGRTLSVSRAEAPGGGTVCIFEDITARIRAQGEREQLEAQLRQAQKMEAVGQLTGGIAHDFNNLLTVVLGNAEILAEDRSAQVRGLATTIVDAAERGADLTNKLLAFGRRQSLTLEPLNLAHAIGSMMPLLRRTIGEHIELETLVEDHAAAALADRSLLGSAVLNLVVNARDAMPQGGRLTIATGSREALPGEGALEPGQPVAFVTVADSGHGIAPELLSRVFDPFFTTKDVGKGSGLGLSMVYGFAQQSGGHVSIRSEVGQGTVITIVLPSAEAAAQRIGLGTMHASAAA